MNRNYTVLAAAVLAAGSLFAGGCQSTPKPIRQAVEAYWAGDYPKSAAILQAESDKKDESYILNKCRYGSAALAAGNYPVAQAAFYDASLVINSAQTTDPGHAMAAAIVMENYKVWKGEPFERAMAHYYLGMLFLQENEYDTAGAAFRNSISKLRAYHKDDKGEISDKFDEKESDFALGYFGAGFAWFRNGRPDLAETYFAKAIQYQPAIKLAIAEAKKPTTNTLIFIDYGQGPQLAPRGWYNEESAYGPKPSEDAPVPPAAVILDGKAVVQGMAPVADTLAMAQLKLWQDIDTIRKAKAAIGTGMMVAGGALMADGSNRKHGDKEMWAGVGLLAAGALVSASSQADLRYWEMLPRSVFVIPMGLPPGKHKMQVVAGNLMSQEFDVDIKPAGKGDSVYYVRLRTPPRHFKAE